MSIGRICNRTVYLAVANETVAKAAERMADHKTGTLIIVNDLQQPIGIVTDRDLVTRVMATGKDPQQTLIGDVMTRRPLTVSENTPIEAVIATMRSGGFRRIPVVAQSERLMGVVSLDDVLSLLSAEFSKIGGIVEAISPD